MKEYKRVFVIVIDSLGIGAMPDGEKFGDVGVNTLGHISESEAGNGQPDAPSSGACCGESSWISGCSERAEQRERYHDRPLGDHGN